MYSCWNPEHIQMTDSLYTHKKTSNVQICKNEEKYGVHIVVPRIDVQAFISFTALYTQHLYSTCPPRYAVLDELMNSFFDFSAFSMVSD